MITLKFANQAKLRNIQAVKLADYEAFFKFYVAHYDRGIIFDVQEVPDDQHNKAREAPD
jgi:hypothetical protein